MNFELSNDHFNTTSISPLRFPKTLLLVEKALQEEVFPGCTFGVWTKSSPDRYLLHSMGKKRIFPNPQDLSIDTFFDLASLTKILVTAPLVAYTVERGWLSYNTYLKEIFSDFPYPEIQVQHLLSHSAGYTSHRPYYETLAKQFQPHALWQVPIAARSREMKKLIFQEKPNHPVGTHTEYSDIGPLLVGWMLEEIFQERLDQIALRYLFQPMGLQSFHYREVNRDPQKLDSRYAATEQSEWRGGVLQGQVHDDNAWAMGGIAGHAGLFGTAKDCLKFIRALDQGFFSPKILHQMWTKVSQDRTLGWDTPSGESSSTGKAFSPWTVGHLGFTGTSLWFDRYQGFAIVLLTNRVHPTREQQKIKEFRPKFHETFGSEIEKVN